MGKTHIKIEHINKIYSDGTHALKDINLEVEEGEILVLLGSSGCGKSTLLRTIGGLEQKTSGSIYFYDKEISGVPVEKRDIGFVFQSYALFPTMTVRQNIAFGLKLRKTDKASIEKKVEDLLHMMDLEPYADKKPQQLSGGQQQRVAIARVLAVEPKVLLMDEPLTALDAKLKERLRIELGRLLRSLGITTIYVTHDQLEAMALADKIAIMNGGVIEQIGTPEQIYSAPSTSFVAQFIGKINTMHGTFTQTDGSASIQTVFGSLPYSGNMQYKNGESVNFYVRLEDMHLANNDDESTALMSAEVTQVVFMGSCCQIGAIAGQDEIYFEESNTTKVKPGDTIKIGVDKNKIIVI